MRTTRIKMMKCDCLQTLSVNERGIWWHYASLQALAEESKETKTPTLLATHFPLIQPRLIEFLVTKH